MVTLALIGVGQWGINFLKTVEDIEGCQIKYLVSKTQNSLSRFSNQYIKTTNYKDLLNYSDIDGLIIATPGSTHFEIIKIFLDKEYYILVEKPFIINYGDALGIKEILEEKKSKIMVGHIYLYNEAYLSARKLISQIGKLRYISFKGYNYGHFRDDMSALWEWAPHGISICLDIMEDLPIEVASWGIETLRPTSKLYDNVYIRLKFKGGINCILEFGWLYPFKRRELIIYGSKSTILFDDLADKKITLYKDLGPVIVGDKVSKQQPKVSYPSYKQETPLKKEIEEFIKFIREGKEPKADLENALSVTAIIDAAQRSLINNGKIIDIK